MIISNLKIGTSYFFTPLQEFAKENIRYHFDRKEYILKSVKCKLRKLAMEAVDEKDPRTGFGNEQHWLGGGE